MSEEKIYTSGNIQSRDIVSEMEESYLNYSMSVIVSRALPDVRDGLKPVHRRVLFGASDLGATWNRSYKKSARIVGEVLGKYHPHGDSSVYDSLVRMAQPWSLRYNLIDGQGNFGSIDGDNAAAMRYTEAKMDRIASEMLKDIDKDTVEFTNNFDDSLKEPSVLPSFVAIIIESSPFEIFACISWSPSFISIAYTPPFLGLLYKDRDVLLIMPFFVAITINWLSSNVLTGKNAWTCSPGSHPMRLIIALPCDVLKACGI